MRKRKLNKIMFDKEAVRSFKYFLGNRITLKTVFIFLTLILCIGNHNLDFMVYVFLVAIGLALLTELFKIKKINNPYKFSHIIYS